MKVHILLLPVVFYLGFFSRHLLAARKRIIRKLGMFRFGHF